MSKAVRKPKPLKGVPGTLRGRDCVGGATSSTPGLGHPVGAGLGWLVSEGPGCQLAGPSNPNRVLCKFEGCAPSTWGAGGWQELLKYMTDGGTVPNAICDVTMECDLGGEALSECTFEISAENITRLRHQQSRVHVV